MVKVNIFLTDLDEWPRLNSVYKEMMPNPKPVRTAVQAGLLFTLKLNANSGRRNDDPEPTHVHGTR